MSETPVAPNRSLVFRVGSLIVFAVVAALIISLVENYTRDQIELNHAREAMRTLGQVLPDSGYDNEPPLDGVYYTDLELLGSDEALPAYPALQQGQLVATAYTVVAPDGYVGPVRLLIGVNSTGGVIAVRVIEHRETPGLGDLIDRNKSDWINIFAGRRLFNDNQEWQLRKDGGDFDQMSGATITSRAVMRAVQRTLEFHARTASVVTEDTATPPIN